MNTRVRIAGVVLCAAVGLGCSTPSSARNGASGGSPAAGSAANAGAAGSAGVSSASGGKGAQAGAGAGESSATGGNAADLAGAGGLTNRSSGGADGHGGTRGGASGTGAAGGRAGEAGRSGAGLGGIGSGGAGAALGGTGGSEGGAGSDTAGAGGHGAINAGPPMGWASWNSFAAKIDYAVIKGQADALATNGMKAAGYAFVNIDEGWWQGTRDSAGNITVDTSDWPGGMQAIADYIHGLGLKAGIYTDAGKDGCGYYYPTGRPAAPGSGSEGHYEQDFLAFSQWGFDFVKVDWCGGDKEGLSAQTAYQSIADAIKKATQQTGRPLVLSVCNWGNQNPWSWAPAIATLWRTSQDIIYYGDAPDMSRVLTNFDSAQHPTSQSPGHYNDPDMLIVGMSGFSAAQNRTHLSLWAISGAPLLAGNALDTMSSDTASVLTNPEVIAIDQDPLAKQGTKVTDAAGRQVYSKELSGTGRRAVLLLNRTTSSAMLSVRFADLGLGATATVRNVWTATDLGMQTTSYSASVPAMDSVLLVVSGEM
jgi:hypothetical protein